MEINFANNTNTRAYQTIKLVHQLDDANNLAQRVFDRHA